HGQGVVLVVDTDPENRGIARANLVEASFDVVMASNGQEALGLARAIQPTAILLSTSLPGLTGWDVLTLLQSQPDTAAIPVVMLSPLDGDAPMQARIPEYLAKPLDEEKLAGILERLEAGTLSKVLVLASGDQHVQESVRRVAGRGHWKIVEAPGTVE